VDRPNFLADERHGPLPAMLLVLTFVSGLIDAISILALGRVFVANMTGNVVFIGFAIAGAPGFSLRNSACALAGFVVGAVLAGRLVDRWGRSRPLLLRNAVAVESLLIGVCLVISLFVHLREDGPVAGTIVVGIAAIAMAVQNVTARRMAVPDMMTTLLTMTLIGITADHDKFAESGLRRLVVMATMFLGATVGALLVLHATVRLALAVVLVLLLAVCVAAAVSAREEAPWQA
jgi:uncharacterized membrane protein YoaK (UPF0700 family)